MLVFKAAAGFLMFTFVLAAYAVLWVGPLALLLFLVRRWLPLWVPRVVLMVGCVASTSYWLYRMEWFDVWRHGTPSVRYVIETHGPLAVVFAAIGWFLGSLIAPKEKPRGAVVRPGVTPMA